MSRVPYEVQRARKRATGHSRVGSETPTETEFDFDGTSSLASYSTNFTSSSYRPSSSSSRAFIHEDGDHLRRRTLSPGLSQSSRSPSFNNQAFQNSLFPPRHASSSSNSLQDSQRPSLPDVLQAPGRSSRPGETDEERRARREIRRAERHAGDAEGSASRATLRSEKKARVKKDKEDEEERKFGSALRDVVKWGMRGGAEGSRMKGLRWVLGGVLGLRIVLLLSIGRGGPTSLRPPTGTTLDHLFPWLPPIVERTISKSLTHFLKHPIWDKVLALLLEMAILWTGVVVWVNLDGKRQGRSWRTQLTGVLTILFQPSLIISGFSDPYLPTRLGLAIWALVFFSKSQDIKGCLAVSLLGATSGSAAAWTLLPGLGSFLVGKCIWLGGSRGPKHLALLFGTMSLLLSPPHLPTLLSSLFVDKPGPTPAVTEVIATSVKRLLGGVIGGPVGAVGERYDKHWVRILAMCISQAPATGILLYTSLSTRLASPTPPRDVTPVERIQVDIPPITGLLPLSLAASSIPLYLLSSPSTIPSAGDILFPLLPLTLMMGLHGEDESWDVGVLVSNVAMFSLRKSYRSSVSPSWTFLALLATATWDRVIHSTTGRMSDRTSLQKLSYATRIAMACFTLLELAEQVTIHTSIRLPSLPPSIWLILPTVGSYLSSGVLWAVWVWTIKKLAESAWAIGGFSGMDRGTGRLRAEPKVVVQVIET